ncbi:DUF1289 domain-containing protein [Sphingosinithalassobacter portus]|uniref:DUF1289 domain-containing protein n=1 Tax=Stakelama portus TaxID=2676234 RepID=UPI000D6DDA4D|nr:DUF1289 domain-containing protein [Sphingosinithalassobacter portus]
MDDELIAYLPPEPIESPCSNICRIARTTGLCEGCSRTIDEIARWGTMDVAERRAIMAELPKRGGGYSR